MSAYTETDQRADTAFLVGVNYGRRAQAADIAAWLDGQMQALPEQRTDAAHGRADIIRELRAYLGTP